MSPTPGPHTRAMTPADVPAVHALETRTSPRPWTAGNLASCLVQEYPAWVLTDTAAPDAPVIAYAILAVLLDEGHLLNIAVAPEHQGRGHARHLLGLMRDHAGRRGCRTLLLEVRVSNTPARRLYESTGFTTLGVRKRYYPNPDGTAEDAVVCGLELAPAPALSVA